MKGAEKQERIRAANERLATLPLMKIKDAEIMPNVLALHNQIEYSDSVCFFMVQHFADGLEVVDVSENVELVTGVPKVDFLGRKLSDIEKSDDSDPNQVLASLGRRATTKKLIINEREFLALIWKEGNNTYGEYLIRL